MDPIPGAFGHPCRREAGRRSIWAGSSVDAEPGNGPPGTRGESRFPSAPASATLRLLLVEDNLPDARLVAVMLAESSAPRFELVHVRRTQDAIRRLAENAFDAVLLDLGLPDAHELEALNQVSNAAPQLPIVVLTGRENETLAVQAMRRGAQDYLVKGWSSGRVLVRSIRYAIERKRTEQHISHLAYHDPLTDLPNRLLLQDRLNHSLAHARRRSEMLAVVFIDLDLFKAINDTLGHTSGDELLVQVAGRLRGCIRESDTAARIGGDEFALVISEILRFEDAPRLAERVSATFNSPFRLAGQETHVSASIGISLYPTHGQDAETLLRNADAAMYQVKKRGRNHLRFHTELMNGSPQWLARGADLRRALEQDELRVHYQPQMNLESGNIIGLEALVRWQHPRRGLLSPGEFLPVAEDGGLIGSIDGWVLRQACAQLGR